jgi:hypothetical protein
VSWTRQSTTPARLLEPMPTRRDPALAAATIGACALVPAAAASAQSPDPTAPAASGATTFTVYSVTNREVYINNQDDRERGVGHNPFNQKSPKETSSKDTGNGPFAGDAVEAVNILYATDTLKQRSGSTAVSCAYGFDENATCLLSIKLAGGSLEAIGNVHHDAKRLTLAIVGGTGDYTSATGELDVAPATKTAQKFTITLS